MREYTRIQENNQIKDQGFWCNAMLGNSIIHITGSDGKPSSVHMKVYDPFLCTQGVKHNCSYVHKKFYGSRFYE